MSEKLVKAHGGSRDILAVKGEAVMAGGLLHSTTQKIPQVENMKHFANLISQTTGIPQEKPVMSGVLVSTRAGDKEKPTPEFHAVPKSERSKTKPKRSGQVSYSGPKY